jgi:23S rRNA pseudouridine2605 synthase
MAGQGSSGERLQKVLAAAGVASRRHAEELIRAGRVTVDGQVVEELGTRVGPRARIAVDGKPIRRSAPKVYYLLHKPPGYVSTASDPEGRPTVLDLVPDHARVYPVGRLDYDSEGLILLTNDGELTNLLLHPSRELEREYYVLVAGPARPEMLRALRSGIDLDGRPTARARVSVVEATPEGIWLSFVIHEGRNRQVRRMCDAVGLEVRRLVRTRMGPLELGRLPIGRYRELRKDELAALRAAVMAK